MGACSRVSGTGPFIIRSSQPQLLATLSHECDALHVLSLATGLGTMQPLPNHVRARDLGHNLLP
jgi:hypothetical protein